MKYNNQFKMNFPSKSVNESFARMAVSSFCMSLDPTVEEINEIKLAVSEAVTNCVVHGYKDTLGIVYITAGIKENIITISIRDKGIGIKDVKKAMEPMFTTGDTNERAGLGFAVMQMYMDKVRVFSKEGKGTRVVMTKEFKQRK